MGNLYSKCKRNKRSEIVNSLNRWGFNGEERGGAGGRWSCSRTSNGMGWEREYPTCRELSEPPLAT